MADDLGWGDLGCFGHPDLKTPYLDALASVGLRLTRFHAAAPVCSPTRASCLTGRHPYRAGIRNANSGHLGANEVTLQGLLSQAVGGAIAAGVSGGDFYVPKLRRSASAAGSDQGPGFDRAGAAGDGAAVRGA